MVVAELFAVLGLKVDASTWERGQAALNRIQSGLGRIAKWGAVAAAGLGAGAAVLGDSYTELENRIRQVSSSTEEMNELMDRTRAIANATRSDWKSTGEAFVRLKNATKDMGLSTDRALALVETLNMALQSSGASASEAAAGTLQLMQGLASGALQGDEFRSIAEQLPDLLDLFAKEMGVSRGELKKLGSEGKITSKVVVSALENASDSIRQKFAASTATAAQGWTVLKNNLTLAAAEFIRSTGLMEALGRAVQAVTEWIESHRDQIREFGVAVGAAFAIAADVVASVVGFLLEHRDVLEALALVLIALGTQMAIAWIAAQLPILATIAALTALALVVMDLWKSFTTGEGVAADVWRWITDKARGFWNFIKSIPGRIADAFRSMGDAIVDAVVGAFDTLLQKAKDTASAIWAEIKDIPIIGHIARGAEFIADQVGETVGTSAALGQLQSTSAPSTGATMTASVSNSFQITQQPGESGEDLARRIVEHDQRARRAAFDALRGGVT